MKSKECLYLKIFFILLIFPRQNIKKEKKKKLSFLSSFSNFSFLQLFIQAFLPFLEFLATLEQTLAIFRKCLCFFFIIVVIDNPLISDLGLFNIYLAILFVFIFHLATSHNYEMYAMLRD